MFPFKKRPLYSAERTERGKRRLGYFIVGAVFFVVGGGVLVSWVSYRDEVTIHGVRIIGAEAVSRQEVSDLVEHEIDGAYVSFFGFEFFNRANSVLYPRKIIERKLSETFPRLASVSVYRLNFHEINVKVRERVPSYLWCGEELPLKDARRECYFLDSEGFAFTKAPYFSGSVYFELYGKMEETSIFQLQEHEPLVVGNAESPIGRSFLSPGDFTRVIALRNALAEYGIPPEKLVVEENGDALLFFPSGLSLKFLLTQDFSVILSNLRAAMDTEPLQKEFFISAEKNPYEFLDARFKNRIFYK